MRLRQTFTAYVLTLGLCLLFLTDGSGPAADGTRGEYDGQMRILDTKQPASRPSTIVVATPKGRRAVKRVALGHYDIPLTALRAYQRAADILSEVKPSCGLPWTLLAAIGRVESDHGRYAGATLGTDGVSSPEVIGVALDGHGPVAAIHDTDDGVVDQDRRWDRAVGPMQFLPATWAVVGVDGDGDGTRSIGDIDDAALAAGVYLCAGDETGLSSPEAMDSALHRYNDSDSYAALVMAYERKYRGGDFEVITPDGELAVASALTSHPLTGTPLKADSPAEARAQARMKAQVRQAVTAARRTGGTTAGISATTTVAAGTTSGQKTASAGPGATAGSPAGPTSEAGASAGAGGPAPSTSPGGTGGTGGTDSGTGSTSPDTAAPAPSGSDTSAPDGSAAPSPAPDPTTSDPAPAVPTCTATADAASPAPSPSPSDPLLCDPSVAATDPQATTCLPCDPAPSPAG